MYVLSEAKETAMAHPAMFELPTTDPLTGLLGAAYFRHLVREQLLSQAGESGDPLSLFLFDIEAFHGINQRHERAVGDHVLTAVAQALRETMPDTATLT